MSAFASPEPEDEYYLDKYKSIEMNSALTGDRIPVVVIQYK